MRPTPIPDAEVVPGHERLVMAPPDGDLTGDGGVEPVEMLVAPAADGSGLAVFSARIVLEDDDLERLTAGEPFWVSFYGHVVPFDVTMGERPA